MSTHLKAAVLCGALLATIGCPTCPEQPQSVNVGVSGKTLDAAEVSPEDGTFSAADCEAICEIVLSARSAGTVTDVTSCTLLLVAADDIDDPEANSAHLTCTADRQPLCK